MLYSANFLISVLSHIYNKSCTAQNRSIWRKRISQTFRCFIFSLWFVLFCFFVLFLTLQWLITACKHAPLLPTCDIKKKINKGGKFLKKLWCCVGGRIKHHKLANVKSLKADVSSVSLSSERLVEGVTLETSAFKLFTMANLCYQLSWYHQINLTVKTSGKIADILKGKHNVKYFASVGIWSEMNHQFSSFCLLSIIVLSCLR